MTPAQAKAKLRQQGITVTQWAAEHGYRRTAVYRVLNGLDRAYFGRAYEIAMKLGIRTAAPGDR